MLELLLKPHIYNRLRQTNIYSTTLRHFSIKKSQSTKSTGFGMARKSLGEQTTVNNKEDYFDKFNEFYSNAKMQKLWNNTFERISSLQASSPQGSDNHRHHNNQSSSSTPLPQNQQSSEIVTKNASNSRAQKADMFSLDDQQKMRLSFAEGYFYGQTRRSSGRFKTILYYTSFFFAFNFFVYWFITKSGNSRVRRVLKFDRVKEIGPEEIKVTFSDVKGCDESKQELYDVVEFLRNPDKFSRLGGKLPKGVLLVGPPGTGKTLLARAVAGEANVPFFHAAGSEFEELLVGQGARRVRDLFQAAKQRTPCVVFIDEIDAVGGKRSNSSIHPYANQTINQLLSEMDGFTQNEGVIVLGATNRQCDLDKALLRPGRFDVKVTVPCPDYKGRKELFEHYLNLIRASSDLDLDVLCRTTVNFTGADIENIVNQAAIKSASDGLDTVDQEALEWARDKILMGPEKKSRLADEETNKITSYHEGGHALVALFTKKAHPLHKVTIIKRGNALGHTAFIPEKDTYGFTKEQMQAQIDVALGGRIAEELIYGDDKVTTGCSDDLKVANNYASLMVKDYGMSEKVGMRVLQQEEKGTVYSEAISELAESEISRILSESRERVTKLLTQHKEHLKLLAEALMKHETLDAREVNLVIDGKDPKDPHEI